MWENIAVIGDLAGIPVLAAVWIRMVSGYRRAGVRILAMSALVGLPPTVRRRLLRAIRHGEVMPAELQDVALRWAHEEVLRKGVCWTSMVGIVMMAGGLPYFITSTDPSSEALFWMELVGLCGIVASTVFLWRDQLAASRLLRAAARPV